MPKQRIDHYDSQGLTGHYTGHSVRDDDGRVDHFENTGSIIPGEKYVGHSKIEKKSRDSNDSGGSSGGAGGAGGILFFLSPILIILGLIALAICPALWLFWRLFKKKRKSSDQNDDEWKFEGIGWIILGLFMAFAGLTMCGTLVQGLYFSFANQSLSANLHHLSWEDLFQFFCFLIVSVSWSLSILIGGIDILRRNSIVLILVIVATLVALFCFGHFFVFRNSLRPKTVQPTAAVVAPASKKLSLLLLQKRKKFRRVICPASYRSVISFPSNSKTSSLQAAVSAQSHPTQGIPILSR